MLRDAMPHLHPVIILLILTSEVFSQDNSPLPDTLQYRVDHIMTDNEAGLLLDKNKALIFNQPELGVVLARRVEDISQRRQWANGSFKANTLIGIYYQTKGEYEMANYYYSKADSISRVVDDLEMLTRSNNNFGVLHRRRGNYDSALLYYKKALNYSLKLDDSVMIGMLYSNLGLVSVDREEFEKGLDYYLKALSIREKMQDEDALAATYNNIGILYGKIRDHERSLYYYLKCKTLWDEFGNYRQRRIINQNIGAAYFGLGSYDEAIKYQEMALPLAREIGDRQGEAFILDNLGYLAEKHGDLQRAYHYTLEGLEVQQGLDNKQQLIKVNVHLSKVLGMLDQMDQAILYGQRAYDLAHQNPGFFEKAQASHNLASMFEKRGDFEKALKYYTIYTTNNDSLKTRRYENDIAEMQQKYEANKKQEQLELQQVQLEHQKLEFQRASLQRNFLLLAITLIIIILVMLIWVYQTRLKAKELVFKKSKEYENMRSNFFANISHEFRTPLTLIKGPLEQIIENKKADEVALGIVKRNAERIERLISQILALSVVEEGQIKIDLQPTDLHALIRTTASFFTIEATAKGLEYIVEVPENQIIVCVDRDKIEKIIFNLLSNAIKFTDKGDQVKLMFNIENATAFLEVSDTGRGIPEDQTERIFERFNRSWAGNDYRYEGSGIGLALTKELVQVLGGSIAVRNNAPKGSIFKISLPIEMAGGLINDTITVERRSAVQKNELSESDEFIYDQVTMVLIVDDSVDMQTYIASCLDSSYQVVFADNGKEGMKKSIEQVPDIIISDLMMPEMDGIEFCKNLRAARETSHIPFIILTARADEKIKIEGLGLGADDYLIKPFNKKELSHKVNNILDRSRALQERLRFQILAEPQLTNTLSADELFIYKLKCLIEENLSETELSVESLSREIALSRVQLYRKVLSLTGISVNQLIRSIRLMKAANLLDQKWGSVSQVAYEVGFNNLSYFAKCFKKAYGKSPSQYSEQEERTI